MKCFCSMCSTHSSDPTLNPDLALQPVSLRTFMMLVILIIHIYIYIHPLGLFSIFWGWQQQLDVHLLCKDGFCLHRDPSNHLSLSWLFSKTAARTVRRHALHDNAVSKPFLCERTWEDFQQPISGATMEEKKTKIKDLYMYLKQTINSYWSLLTTFYLTSSDEEFKPTVKSPPIQFYPQPSTACQQRREEINDSFKF